MRNSSMLEGWENSQKQTESKLSLIYLHKKQYFTIENESWGREMKRRDNKQRESWL